VVIFFVLDVESDEFGDEIQNVWIPDGCVGIFDEEDCI